MADATIEAIAEQNRLLAEQNRQLNERLSALEAATSKPSEPTTLPAGAYLHFPRLVYQRNLDSKSIDVPGNDVLEVRGQEEYDAAKADGWSDEPVPMPDPKKAAKAANARR